jgi:hypothetical protein
VLRPIDREARPPRWNADCFWVWRRVAMQLTFTSQETRLLLHHLTERIGHLETELIHTDKRELQHSLTQEVQALRALLGRIESSAIAGGEKTSPQVV